MRGKMLVCVMVLLMVMFQAGLSEANTRSSDLLKQGLLGAGSGAVGGAASGAKGGDIWKGALAGAGVNIVGGALLDSLSGERVSNTQSVDNVPSRDAYSQGYQDGYQNGYKAGYTQGYRDGLREATMDR
ncbi:MAG: hypothetical protein WCV56_04675 [Candidatus Omnitrophota bacterium]